MADGELGVLPTWDLRDLYPGRDSPEVQAELERGAAAAKVFRERHQGKLAGYSGAALAGAIAEYERLEERLGRLGSYAQLLHAGDMADPEIGRFYQTITERLTEISSETLFFALELNRIEDKALEEKLQDKALAHWRPWLRDVRAFRPHQLSDEAEKLLLEKSVAGRAAWVRLFDETMAALRFPVDGKELTEAEVLNLLSGRDGVLRRKAAESLGEVLGKNLRLFGHVTNTLAKDKAVEDVWRKFPRPVSARNLSNHLEDDVVDALVAAVKSSYPTLSHRYYKLKAKWFGVEALDFWDRNAPLPNDDDRLFQWDEAKSLVLGAYGRFSGEMADVGKKFFDHPWIDAPARAGKASGAFAHPTVPSAHPYLLLNYQGKARDVMTLAHELGHGVHQVLAGPRGHLMADTPLTLAETASVFGEMLTFRALLEGAKADRRKVLLAGKVEDMLNTVLRQIALYEFERHVHDERKAHELLPERFGEIWLKVQSECLGPAIKLGDGFRHYWAYIPHFIHTPFYVYAYAFGDCLVNSLYAVYESGHPKFAEAYLDMLRAGGTKHHKELLVPFGLDASDPAFWSKGLSLIGRMVDELEEMG
jgi:oligoendopeptidase F